MCFVSPSSVRAAQTIPSSPALACVQMASLPAAIVLLCFCSGALVALIGRAILPKPLSTLCNGGYYFLLMQGALLTGWFKYLGGGLEGAWERTKREGGGNDE